jgi:hypothetical protein
VSIKIKGEKSTYLNLGFSFVTIPTSISVGLKSTERTVERHMIANCGGKNKSVYSHSIIPRYMLRDPAMLRNKQNKDVQHCGFVTDLDSFLAGIILFLLQFLLEIAVGFRVFGAHANRSITTKVASWVRLVHTWSIIVIIRY